MKEKTVDFGKDPIAKILFRLAPPVMLAQLIQALYNIVDSFFVGRNSESGLTALSIVYPLQLLMIALAVGTGVGINTLMAHFSGLGREEESQESAGLAMPLAVLSWIAFALLCFFSCLLMQGFLQNHPMSSGKSLYTGGSSVCAA